MADEDIRAELQSLQRLEGDFARHRSEFQRTRDDVIGLNNEIANLKNSVQSDISDLKAVINSLAVKLDEKSKPNWPAVGLAVAIVPAVWLFVTTYTANAISPTHSLAEVTSAETKRNTDRIGVLEQGVSASTSADVASRSDRTQLNDRVRTLETTLDHEIADRRTDAAAFKVSLAEIESQFRSVSNVENLRTAYQHRMNSLMWEKTFPGSRYPSDTFFPTSLFQPTPGQSDPKP